MRKLSLQILSWWGSVTEPAEPTLSWSCALPLSALLSLWDLCHHGCWPRELIIDFASCVVQSPRCVCLFAIPWTAAHQASLSFTISQSLLKFKTIESVMLFNHLCHPLLLLPSRFPSIRAFSNGSTLCIRRPKYWGFNFSISPFNEHSGLISFRINWFDLLAVQGWKPTVWPQGRHAFQAVPALRDRFTASLWVTMWVPH